MDVKTDFKIEIPKYEYLEHNSFSLDNHEPNADSDFTDFFGESILYFYENKSYFTKINIDIEVY